MIFGVERWCIEIKFATLEKNLNLKLSEDASIEQFVEVFDEGVGIDEEVMFDEDYSFDEDEGSHALLEYLFDSNIEWEEVQDFKLTKDLSLQVPRIVQIEKVYDENSEVDENHLLDEDMLFDEDEEADELLSYLLDTEHLWDTVDRFIIEKDLSLQVPQITMEN